MPRVKGGTATKKRHNRILKAAKGYWGAKSRLIRSATQAVDTAQKYSTRDRRVKKRDFRSLWITRISAAVKEMGGGNYSRFMAGLEKNGIKVNRKMLSEIAVRDPSGFQAIIKAVQA